MRNACLASPCELFNPTTLTNATSIAADVDPDALELFGIGEASGGAVPVELGPPDADARGKIFEGVVNALALPPQENEPVQHLVQPPMVCCLPSQKGCTICASCCKPMTDGAIA